MERLGDLPKATGPVRSTIGLVRQPRDVPWPMVASRGGHGNPEAGQMAVAI